MKMLYVGSAAKCLFLSACLAWIWHPALCIVNNPVRLYLLAFIRLFLYYQHLLYNLLCIYIIIIYYYLSMYIDTLYWYNYIFKLFIDITLLILMFTVWVKNYIILINRSVILQLYLVTVTRSSFNCRFGLYQTLPTVKRRVHIGFALPILSPTPPESSP